MGVGGGGPGTCNAHPYIYIHLQLHMNTHIHTSMYIYIFPVKFCEFVVSFCWVGVCTQSPKSFRVQNLKVSFLGVPKHHHY